MKKNDFCAHLKFGSSNFFRLINSSLTAKRVHNAERMRCAHIAGNIWEKFIAIRGHFLFSEQNQITFEVISEQPFAKSQVCLVIVSTADFLIRFKKNGQKERIEFLEVKSTVRIENYSSFKTSKCSEQRYQLQVSLQCFNLETGFLVFVHGDTEKAQFDDPSAEILAFEINREKFFFKTHKHSLLKGISNYVASCIFFPDSSEVAILEFCNEKIKEFDHAIGLDRSNRDLGEVNYINDAKKNKIECNLSDVIRKKIGRERGFKPKVGRLRVSYWKRKAHKMPTSRKKPKGLNNLSENNIERIRKIDYK